MSEDEKLEYDIWHIEMLIELNIMEKYLLERKLADVHKKKRNNFTKIR